MTFRSTAVAPRALATALALSPALALAPAAHATDFEFWYGNTGTIEEAIQANCASFNAAQTEHVVTCVGQGGYETAMQKAIAAYRSGTHPVLIQFFDAGTLDLLLSDAVVPVSEVLPDVDWNSYIGGARSYYETASGALWSQPYNASTLVFYGNREQLASVGVTELPTTWEGVIEVATKLRDAGHECPYATDGHPWRVLEQFAARHGAPVATQGNGFGGLDAEYAFNAGLPAQHLDNLARWRSEGLVRLAADTRAGRFGDAFNAGECAMIENSTGGYSGHLMALGDNLMVGLAPMYEGVERRNTLVGGASIYIMKGHDDDQIAAAKAFLDYLRDPGPQLDFVKATGYVPVTQEALDVLKAEGLTSDPAFAAAELGVGSMDVPGNDYSRGIRLGFFVQFRDIFIEETQKAFNGEKPMQVALDSAKARGDELLRRFEQTYAGVALP